MPALRDPCFSTLKSFAPAELFLLKPACQQAQGKPATNGFYTGLSFWIFTSLTVAVLSVFLTLRSGKRLYMQGKQLQ